MTNAMPMPATAGSDAARPLPRLARDTTPENPWPVSLLARKYHDAVEQWPAAWVEGQITEINARRTGSVYITLRDNTSDSSMQVSGWGEFARAASQFVQGDRVVVYGKPEVWMKFTRLSVKGLQIMRVGKGDLTAQIEELRMRLKGEGLFDEANKVALPEFPRTIGLICAPQARAEGDVITNTRLRWPTIDFIVRHVHVQGASCPPEVVHAIEELDASGDCDVIIVARGGGSFEDLIGFSDEGVVRATAACRTPIVSAIGHEDDWTLIDLAADLRASTPTDAAKRVVPDVMEQLALVDEARRRMFARVDKLVSNEERLIEGYANRPSLTNPLTMLERPQRIVDEGRQRLDIALRRTVDEGCATIEKLHATLTALSPQSTLDRGYAVVQGPDGAVLDDPDAVPQGARLTITLRHGPMGAVKTGD